MAIEVAGGNPQPSYQKCFQFQGEKKKSTPGTSLLFFAAKHCVTFCMGYTKIWLTLCVPLHPQRSAMSLEPKKVPLLIECACKPSKLWEWVRVRLLLERGALESLRLPVLGVICGCLIDVAAPTRSSKRYSRWGNCFHYRKREGGR